MNKDELEAWVARAEERISALERVIMSLEQTFTGAPDGNAESQLEKMLVNKHGERVNKKTASEIIGVTRATVYAMLTDGRIDGACDGRMVSVRSIARYMESPFTDTTRKRRKHEDPQSGD